MTKEELKDYRKILEKEFMDKGNTISIRFQSRLIFLYPRDPSRKIIDRTISPESLIS